MYVTVTATITDRWGNVESVYAGSQPAWTWEDRAALDPWRKTMRRELLSDRTTDPRGWRVVFTAELLED